MTESYEEKVAQAIEEKLEDEKLAKAYVNKFFDEYSTALKSDDEFKHKIVNIIKHSSKNNDYERIEIPDYFVKKEKIIREVEIKKRWWDLTSKKRYCTKVKITNSFPAWYNEIADYFDADPRALFGTYRIVLDRPYLKGLIKRRKGDLLRSLLIEKKYFPRAEIDCAYKPAIFLNGSDKYTFRV